MKTFFLFLCFLTNCKIEDGQVELTTNVNRTYRVSNTATQDEVQAIQEVFQEFTRGTGITLSLEQAPEAINVWDTKSLTYEFNISVVPTMQASYLEANQRSEVVTIVGFESNKNILLLSFQTYQDTDCSPFPLGEASNPSDYAVWTAFQITVFHELGHAYGLEHVQQGTPNNIMNPAHECTTLLNFQTTYNFFTAIALANGL